MTHEINITVNFEVKWNRKTGAVSRATMVKVGKVLFNLYKENRKMSDITAFVKDSNGEVTCWGFDKTKARWSFSDFYVTCNFGEGETEDCREMENTLYIDWLNGQHRELDWAEATIERERGERY